MGAPGDRIRAVNSGPNTSGSQEIPRSARPPPASRLAITRKNGRTELRFTHVGLVPAFECYDDCSGAWGMYVNNSLFQLIAKGKGQPEKKQA